MKSQEREPHTVRAGVGEIHMDLPEEPFEMEIYRKKCTWTCHKSHFVRKFTGKMLFSDSGDRILCGNLQGKTHMDMSQEPFCGEIYRKNAVPPFQDPHCGLPGTRLGMEI